MMPVTSSLVVQTPSGSMDCFVARPAEGSRVVDTLKRLFQDNPNVAYRAVIHAGARHGYSMPDRDMYDHAATDQDWQQIFGMLQRQLG